MNAELWARHLAGTWRAAITFRYHPCANLTPDLKSGFAKHLPVELSGKARGPRIEPRPLSEAGPVSA